MNILSKKTRLFLLATMLCLHFLAVPAMGEDNGAGRKPSARHLEKHGGPNDRGRAAVRTEEHGNLKKHGTQQAQPRKQDRAGRRQGQDRVREAKSAPRRDTRREFEASGSAVKAADHGSRRPTATAKLPDSRQAPREHAEKSVDRHRATEIHAPRQEKTARASHSATRRADWRDGPAKGPHSDLRDHNKHVRENRHYPHIRHDRRPVTVKRVIHKIPERHAVIVHGRERYHYHSGRFYRPWDNGFILVRPPLGLVVLNIPIGSRMVISAGITYHVFGDVYYRRIPSGYQVVEPIRGPVAGWPERVEVITDLLNVRYGPQTHEEVIAQVDRYTTLRVLGGAPGWLYVEVDGEDVRGWVMERYVASGSALG